MTKVIDILQVLQEFSPLPLAMAGDNNGLLAGHSNASVERVLVALDASMAVIDEAVSRGAQLIVAHHPVNRGLWTVTDIAGYDERRMLALLENKIACISMHTNLDAAQGGINDILAELCGLHCVSILDAATQLGRVGHVDGSLTVREYAGKISDTLGCNALRFCDGGKPVCKVAVGSGNSADCYSIVVAKGCDTFVTGDIKYHLWLEALESGINLIDAGHYETEAIACNKLQDIISQRFGGLDVRVSQAMRLPYEVL
ncbi:MAG: Nif3-like dinuclear metal center hexameric protein [Oscillospiraceae bacterium]|nr:Nif3-like dinuclear metal center hexameric protein [Oscillospiraceae bacterium]